MLCECGLNGFVGMQIHKAQERHEFHSCNDRVGSKESTHFFVEAFSFCETFDKLKCYVDITLWGSRLVPGKRSRLSSRDA